MNQTLLQITSLLGAVGILLPFAAVQFGKLTTGATSYSLLNLVGSLLLLIVAIIEFQIGFIVLEVVWAGVSVRGLLRSA